MVNFYSQNLINFYILKGKGKSTVTQTAWALLCLLELKGIYEESLIRTPIEKAITYLLDSFEKYNNNFYDTSVVGTGHRGLLYL